MRHRKRENDALEARILIAAISLPFGLPHGVMPPRAEAMLEQAC
jgi:hypothetical protein